MSKSQSEKYKDTGRKRVSLTSGRVKSTTGKESKSLPSIIQSCEMETSSKYDVPEIGRRRFVSRMYTLLYGECDDDERAVKYRSMRETTTLYSSFTIYHLHGFSLVRMPSFARHFSNPTVKYELLHAHAPHLQYLCCYFHSFLFLFNY